MVKKNYTPNAGCSVLTMDTTNSSPLAHQNNCNPTKGLAVTHINTVVGQGGAAKIMELLCCTQQKMQYNAQSLVGEYLAPMPQCTPFATEPCLIRAKTAHAEGLLDYHFQGSHALYRHPACADAQILHFHNLHGNYFNPYSLAALARWRPSVWTLHDMQAFTGHCAYACACPRWQTGCGQCPNLSAYPSVSTDSAHRLWQDKQRTYASSPLHIVSPSRWLANDIEKSILAEHPCSIIPNGIDTQIFSPQDKARARAALNLPEKTLIVGSAADQGPLHNSRKGGDFALATLNALRKVYPDILFLGRGNAEELHIPNVRLLPYSKNPADMATFYSALDIMLFPSLADNCPLVVLEAMACGIPVLAFNIGGIPELVESGFNGIIVPARDEDALINAAFALSKSHTVRQRMGANARQRAVQEYDVHRMAARYETVYEMVLSQWPVRVATMEPLKLYDIPIIVQTPQFFDMAENTQLFREAKHTMPENRYPQKLWNETYSNRTVEIGGLDNCIIQKIREYLPCGSGNAIEIGCCPGTYIGHLGTMGYTVHGLDASPSVHAIPPIFKKHGLKCGDFIEKDFFEFCTENPPNYDIVSSFGFVEHFENFEKVFFLHCRLVAKNGYLIVMFPNFLGDIQFALHSLLDKANMDRHVIAAMQLDPYIKMAKTLGFTIHFAGYFGGFNFWRENSGSLPPDPALQALHRGVEHLLHCRAIQADSPQWSPWGGIIAQKI